MKRTGAKNYRYTDDHWQSVPTRARFLCFGSNTPGRQFRENSRERARRSPGIDVQESDPPLPFAWQSAKADLGTRTSPRRSAKADLGTRTSPQRSAKADLATGTSPRRSAKADPATGTSPRRSTKADLATGTSPRRSAKAPGGDLPAGHTGRGRAATFRRGTRGRAGRRPSGGAHGAGPGGAKRASSYARKAGLPVLRISQTTQKLRRLLSCFFARKER